VFEQTFKNIDDILHKDAGCTSELDYTEQSSWLLFLKYLDALRFRSQTEKHELSHLYEAKIKNMGNAGRNGGVYYTPRPLIRAMIRVLDPKIGERIYEAACGSAGFPCEVFDGTAWRDLSVYTPRSLAVS
jgi:type I restriction enzyme M protein